MNAKSNYQNEYEVVICFLLGFDIRIPEIFSGLILFPIYHAVISEKKMCLFDEFSLFSIFLDFRLVRAGASHYVFWWGKSRDTLLLASSIHGMKWNLGGHLLKLIRVSGSILYIPLIMFYFSSRVLILYLLQELLKDNLSPLKFFKRD